jgi:hypothetical protein
MCLGDYKCLFSFPRDGFALVLKFLPSVLLILCLPGPSASVWANREATRQCARRSTEQIRQSCWEGAV